MREERHPGYCFTDLDGTQVVVPAARITPAAEYRNVAMNRERAIAIMIAFGLATSCECPIHCRRNSDGFDAVLPLEFIAGLAGVKRLLEESGKA